ncbi:MAG: alpha/beta fold hydrolase [bacterium]|nr:alpha/beta fold hydrolase [bacterium]
MRTVRAGGIDIAFEEHGSGPPLLLLHGYSLDHSLWDAQVGALKNKYRLFVPDLRGLGETKHLDAGAPISIEQLADDAAAFLEALDVSAAAVAGFSMGGFTLFQMAIRHPLKVRAAAFVNTSAGDSPDRTAARLSVMRFISDEGSDAFATAFIPQLFAPASLTAFSDEVEHTRRVIASQDPVRLVMLQDTIRRRDDVCARLHEITCPCAVIGGTEDALIPSARFQEIHDGLPDSTLDIIEGAGHMTPIEAADRVSFALDQLMQRAGMWM